MSWTEGKEKAQIQWKKWTAMTPTNFPYDRTLLWCYLLFLLIGFLAVTSAGVYQNKDAMAFSATQLQNIGISLAVFGIVTLVQIKIWEKTWWLWLLAALALIIITVFIAPPINGAKRWISIFGFNFQSSEAAKLAIIMYTASFLARRKQAVENKGFSLAPPLLVIGIFFSVLYFGQSDTGSSVVILCLMIGMIWIANAKKTQFFGLIAFAVLVLGAEIFSSGGYRLDRFNTYIKSLFDPAYDAQNSGLQGFAAKIAFSEGGFWGRGYGNGVMKLGYLPEAHTDFVLSVWGEEFGWFGLALIIFLFCFFTYRIFMISRQALSEGESGRYKGFLAFGIGLWIFGQCFANLGVASGLLPTKGLTFPFVSYGGTSLVIMSIAFALVLRIDYENRSAARKDVEDKAKH